MALILSFFERLWAIIVRSYLNKCFPFHLSKPMGNQQGADTNLQLKLKGWPSGISSILISQRDLL